MVSEWRCRRDKCSCEEQSADPGKNCISNKGAYSILKTHSYYCDTYHSFKMVALEMGSEMKTFATFLRAGSWLFGKSIPTIGIS